jgi:hypothetical protein
MVVIPALRAAEKHPLASDEKFGLALLALSHLGLLIPYIVTHLITQVKGPKDPICNALKIVLDTIV